MTAGGGDLLEGDSAPSGSPCHFPSSRYQRLSHLFSTEWIDPDSPRKYTATPRWLGRPDGMLQVL